MALSLFSDPMFSQIESAMDRALGRFYGRDTLPQSGILAFPFPSVAGNHGFDIVEREKDYQLHADAPGFDPSDIQVELHEGVLTVRAEKKVESKQGDEQGRTWRSERRYRSFMRSFQVSENANAEEISASLDKGVLTVTIPKLPEPPKPQPRRITVSPSNAATTSEAQA